MRARVSRLHRRAFAVIALGAACAFGAAVAQSDEIQLGVSTAIVPSDMRRVRGTDVQVTFVDVPENSLCPPRAQCVWAGRIVARFRLTQGARDTTAALEWPASSSSEVRFGGVVLGLVSVESTVSAPAGAPPQRGAPYTAKIVVKRT